VPQKNLDIGHLAVAITVALIGGLPLVWLLSSTDSPPPVAAVAAVPVETTISDHGRVSIQLAAPEPEVQSAHLHPAIVRVLQSNGLAQSVGRRHLESLLAGSVLDVLIANDVVLTVPDGGEFDQLQPPAGLE